MTSETSIEVLNPRPREGWPCRKLWLLAVVSLLACGLPASVGGQTQSPIHIIFDMHVDPLPQIPIDAKWEVYDRQVANANWVLDQLGSTGIKVSFLSVGEFMEMVTQEGSAGSGAEVLRRIYADDGQIASHSHNEFRLTSNQWPSFGPQPTLADSIRSWQDNIDWVNAAILVALGDPSPRPLGEINAVKGAHLPSTEAEYHALMELFGLQIREGGPEEDYYGIYNHFIMNPYRPSPDNYLQEGLDGAFVVTPQASVIGSEGIHHGVYQDVSAAAARRLFLQVYLNWRFRDRMGAEERVWAFGWGSHTQDFDEGSPTRSALLEIVEWLETHFMDRVEPNGSHVAIYSSQIESAEAYLSWEQGHPGTSSFDSNGCCLDWDDYLYLRPVAEELWEARWQADLDLGSDVQAFHFRRPVYDVIVAWSDSRPQLRDFSSWIEGECRVIGAETGTLYGEDCSQVSIGAEPVLVTEAPASLLFADGFERGNTYRWSASAGDS